MIVHGYDDEKNTIAVDLPIKRIAAEGIDPWRLDLFDENPLTITVEIGGLSRQLHFRRLQDVSFAYQGQDGRICVGMHDGAGATCIRGTLERVGNPELVVNSLETSERPFRWHFAEYLRTLDQIKDTDKIATLSDGTHFRLFNCSANAVTIAGSRLTFGARGSVHVESLYPLTYMGEMLRELPVPAVLPDGVMWAFEQFGPWNPIVYGAALRPFKHIRRSVMVLVSENDCDPALTAVPMSFRTQTSNELRRHGWDYTVYPKESFASPLMRLTVLSDMSIDLRYSLKPGEIQSSRIALFDLGKSQIRRLSQRKWKEDQFCWFTPEEEGFKLLDIECY